MPWNPFLFGGIGIATWSPEDSFHLVTRAGAGVERRFQQWAFSVGGGGEPRRGRSHGAHGRHAGALRCLVRIAVDGRALLLGKWQSIAATARHPLNAPRAFARVPSYEGPFFSSRENGGLRPTVRVPDVMHRQSTAMNPSTVTFTDFVTTKVHVVIVGSSGELHAET